MSIISFDRLLGIIETICEIILSAVERLKKDDSE